MIAVACIGCGGGDGGPIAPTQDTNGTTPPTAGVDYTDPAQFMQTTVSPANLSMIHAEIAHNNGFTGGNLSETTSYTTVASDESNRNLQTIVALLDTGVNTSHIDMNSPGKIEAWKDFSATNSLIPYDNNGHGSFIAGIVAGNRTDALDTNYGIAYGAHLIIGQVFNSSGYTDNVTISQGLDWVVQQKAALDIADQKRLVAVNLSIGSSNSSLVSTQLKSALLNTLNNGISVVIAAGNEGLSCSMASSGNCSFPAAVPWFDTAQTSSYLNNDGAWIVVGSVDSNGNISSFSNRAGVTASNYLVAPGENIISMDNTSTTGYMIGNGTSFAAPLVSGAMALMAQKWPHLSGRQDAQILFDTATDLGDTGVDAIYGNGMLDLAASFNPVGTVAIPAGVSNVNTAVKAQTMSLANTRLKTSGAMASLASFAPISNTIMVDSYNRDFNAGLASSVYSDGSTPINFDNFMMFHFGKVLFGVDQQKVLPMIGYDFSRDFSIRLSVDDKTLLGMQTDGAFKTGTGRTVYTNAKYSFLNESDFKASVEGTYAYGKASASGDSLIVDITPVHAVGGKIKASYDGFGTGFEIPLRTFSGSMTFNMPKDIDNNGNVITTKATASLAPKTFEHTYSLFYESVLSNMSVLAQLTHTEDAYGISNLVSNEARVFLNCWY